MINSLKLIICYIGIGRTIKPHFITASSGNLLASITTIIDYNFSNDFEIIYYNDDFGVDRYLCTVRAPMSKSKREWARKQLGINFNDEDPNIGHTDDRGNDIEGFLEDSDDEEEQENDAIEDDGCTLSFQPNDLMRSHSLIKDWCRRNKGIDIQPPGRLAIVMDHLKKRGMKGGSLKTYENYFQQEVPMQAEAFKPLNILSSYRRAGILTKSVKGVSQLYVCRDTIMQSCSTYNSLSEANTNRAHNAIENLREHVDVNSEVDEQHMQNLIVDIMTTNIDPKKAVPLNQKRALCLNRESVIAARQAALDLKKLEKAQKAEMTKHRATKKIVTQIAVAQLVTLVSI